FGHCDAPQSVVMPPSPGKVIAAPSPGKAITAPSVIILPSPRREGCAGDPHPQTRLNARARVRRSLLRHTASILSPLNMLPVCKPRTKDLASNEAFRNLANLLGKRSRCALWWSQSEHFFVPGRSKKCSTDWPSGAFPSIDRYENLIREERVTAPSNTFQ